MFTYVGPVQFSLQKTLVITVILEDKEMNDHFFYFLYYFLLKNV